MYIVLAILIKNNNTIIDKANLRLFRLLICIL